MSLTASQWELSGTTVRVRPRSILKGRGMQFICPFPLPTGLKGWRGNGWSFNSRDHKVNITCWGWWNKKAEGTWVPDNGVATILAIHCLLPDLIYLGGKWTAIFWPSVTAKPNMNWSSIVWDIKGWEWAKHDMKNEQYVLDYVQTK